MMKVSNVSTQKALTYCIYMMVAGNFKGCDSVTPCMEKKLMIEYRSQREKDREKLEDAAAKLADKFFLRKLPKEIWDENPRVVLVCNEKTNGHEVLFLGKKWKLRIVGLPRGKKEPKFLYSFTESLTDKKISNKKAA